MKQTTSKIANLAKLIGLAQTFSERVSQQVTEDTSRCSAAMDTLAGEVQSSVADISQLQHRMQHAEHSISTAADTQEGMQQKISDLEQQLKHMREKHRADEVTVLEQLQSLQSMFVAKVQTKKLPAPCFHVDLGT